MKREHRLELRLTSIEGSAFRLMAGRESLSTMVRSLVAARMRFHMRSYTKPLSSILLDSLSDSAIFEEYTHFADAVLAEDGRPGLLGPSVGGWCFEPIPAGDVYDDSDGRQKYDLVYQTKEEREERFAAKE